METLNNRVLRDLGQKDEATMSQKAITAAIQGAKDYTDQQIASIATGSGVFVYKGTVPTYSDLPSDLTDSNNFWLYKVVDTGLGFYWFSGNWYQLDAAKIQSDWAQTDDTLEDFIKNKPETLVNSVNGKTGEVTLTAADVGAFAEANFSAVITTDSWAPYNEVYRKFFTLVGVNSESLYVVDLNLSSDPATAQSQIENWALIGSIDFGENQFTVYTTGASVPAINLPIMIRLSVYSNN